MIIKNARLIKELTEGYDGEYGDIIIKDNIIEKIVPCGTPLDEAGQEVIDAEKKTVMPGLWDLHAHLYLQAQTCNTDTIMRDTGEELFGCYHFAKEYIKQGYTTVRDCGATRDTAIFVRNAINAGDLKGPRLIVSGIIISPTTLGNKTFPLLYAEVDGADELRKVARQELAKGVDFLKYMGTGAYTNQGGVPGKRITTVDELKAIQEVAELDNTYVAVHCHGSEAIERCIELGIRTIEHGSLISDRAIEMLQENETSYIIPTASLWSVMVSGKAEGLVSNAAGKKDDLVYMAFDRWNVANKAGLKLGWGTDITMPEFVETPGLEFKARYECCGMAPMDMLKQATINSAEIAGYGESLGTVKEGKIADLIITDGNPDEDIYVMCKPMVKVIRNGEVLA